jgi:2'-hydroxyisoflavone reductase
MDILVLGGTSFVGRTIVEDLTARGHEVGIFNRGRTGTDLFPEVERFRGDRATGDYAAIEGRSWDAVVDVTAYVPRHVEQALDALGSWTGRYLFVSTGMVYDRALATDPITEQSPRLAPWRATEDVDDNTYGPLKVACEDDLRRRLGDRVTIIRPGWVVGPHEVSGQLTYWVRRAGRAGGTAVPDRLERPMQLVDVRDLARLVALLLERDLSGTYNIVGPADVVTFGEVLDACGVTDRVTVRLEDDRFPLLLPDPTWDALFRISRAAADAVGMPRTPLAQTVDDTRAWDAARGAPPLPEWLSEEDESAVLAGARAG